MKLEKCKWKVRKVGFLRSSNKTRKDKDGGRESEMYFGLADIKVCQECTEVPRIGKLLLLLIY